MEDASRLQEVMLEFRAGKMYLTGTRVVPDTRRGLVRIGRGEEGLIHFQWIDRTQGVVEDDQIILPDEALFKMIDQSSDRVFILKFHLDNRKFFFWMQEPESANDTDLCNSVNNCINQPLAFADVDAAEVSTQSPMSKRSEDTVDDEISSSNFRAGSLADQLASKATSAGPVQLADLQRILRSIQPTGTDGELDGGLGLGDLLKPELVLPLVEKLPMDKGLVSYLPEGQWTPEDLMELLQSPPFRQQVETFTHVLRTGQIDLSQFGIDPSKYKFTVLSFLEALEDSVTKTSEPAETESGKDEEIDPHSRGSRGDAMDES